MTTLHRLLALGSLFCAFSVAGAESLVLPERPEWVLSGMARGQVRLFRMPADRAAIDALPAADRSVLLDAIRLIEQNQAVVRRVGTRFFRNPPGGRLTPDYERTLQEVAISVSYSDHDAPNPLERHRGLLKALPAYSRIHVVTPGRSVVKVAEALAGDGLASRAFIHPFEAWAGEKPIISIHTRPTRWVRDTFLIGTDATGKAVAFAPLAYDNVDDLANSDLSFLRNKWHDTRHIVDLPAFVRGGNVAVSDNSAGERIAFMGGDEIERNEMYARRSLGLAPPRELLPEVIRRIAGTPSLAILPNSPGLFHIDMALGFVAPGVVALIAPVDERELDAADLGVLLAIQRILPRLGFRVIGVPTTAARIRAHRSPVNVVPYVDKQTGKRRVLASRFPDAEVSIDGRKTPLNQAIQAAYAAAGIEVVWIEDRFSDRGGNLHCALLGLH